MILITAREWPQDYEWHVHYPIALEMGIDQARRRYRHAPREALIKSELREQNKTTLLFCDNEKLHGWSFSENT